VAAVDVIDEYLKELRDAGARRLAHGEWGLTLPAESVGGWPLDVGLRLDDGLLRAQALALPDAGDLDPWMLLWWNRQTRLVRFASTRSRDVWVHGELAATEVDPRSLDRLLGLMTEAALAVRGAQAARSRSRNA
jgi:hypothetical protein